MESRNYLLPGTSHAPSARHRTRSQLPTRASQYGVDSSVHSSNGGELEDGGDEKDTESLIKNRNRSSTKTRNVRSFVPFTNDTNEPFYNDDSSDHDSDYHQLRRHNSLPLLPPVVNPTTVIRYTIDEVLSFSYSISGTGAITSLILLFYYGLFTGGPAVLVWGFLIAAFFSAIVVANIAEICSAYPRNAGSVYYWTGQLAPKVTPPMHTTPFSISLNTSTSKYH